jgi:hypothetical protein
MFLPTNFQIATAYEDFLRQARLARALGSPFVAEILEAGFRRLYRAPVTAALLADWPGDPAAAALSLRFNAALHSIARHGETESLSALYRGEHQDFDSAIAEALVDHDSVVAQWMRHPTQTNEVGRAASLIAALTVVVQQTGCRIELLELGSSCGLNLNLAHYAYNLGGGRLGAANSQVCIAPRWNGAPAPTSVPLDIVDARGVDLLPLDPTDFSTRERLISFIWADQPERIARLEGALAIARQRQPLIDQDSAPRWLERQLRRPQDQGTCRVVMHSMVAQYFNEQELQTMLRSMRNAGTCATNQRPLAWISVEWTRDRREVQLWLTCWPDGTSRHLANCHPYGDWIDWL